jgi:phosphocarrier protein
MVERRVTVGSRVGLHARPASLFVQAAARQPVRVLICKDGGKPADARSILSVLAMNARAGDTVVLTAEGDGAEAALDALATVIATDHDAEQTTAGPDTAGPDTAGPDTAGPAAAGPDGATPVAARQETAGQDAGATA